MNIFRNFASIGFLLSIAMLSVQCFAGATEVKAAEAIASTIIYFEKCTGDSPSSGKLERLVRSMYDAGMTPKEFQTGSSKATKEIERLYPGSARPPKRVCVQAVKLYDEVFGAM